MQMEARKEQKYGDISPVRGRDAGSRGQGRLPRERPRREYVGRFPREGSRRRCMCGVLNVSLNSTSLPEKYESEMRNIIQGPRTTTR